MSDNKNFDLLNLLVILVKWKRLLLISFVITLVLSYLAIYFFVDERFEATALLLPSQDEENAGSLLSSLKGLPLDIGGLNTSTDVDLYKSIIYSRSVLNHVIDKFNLVQVYEMDTSKVDYYEETLKKIRSNINADLNDDGLTYTVSVTANDPQLAANMTNYIIQKLNEKIIELKTRKSMENRIFLEARVNDVKDSLKFAEDQLKNFQEKTGMFEAENQTKAVLEQFAQFQANLAVKQTQYSVSKEIYGENSPQTINAKIVAQEFENKLRKMEKGNDNVNSLLTLNKLPQNAINYFRLFRDVEIYTNILEFELPLYEQAKFQEQKNVPILQVIDSAIPPAKRSFPKRTILALLFTIVLMLVVFIFLLIKENKSLVQSDKFIYIRRNLFKWKNENLN